MDEQTKPTEQEAQMTEEQKNIQEFVQEYGKLVEKYQVDWAHKPEYILGEDRLFHVTIISQPVSLKSVSKPSPFMES